MTKIPLDTFVSYLKTLADNGSPILKIHVKKIIREFSSKIDDSVIDGKDYDYAIVLMKGYFVIDNSYGEHHLEIDYEKQVALKNVTINVDQSTFIITKQVHGNLKKTYIFTLQGDYESKNHEMILKMINTFGV